MARHEKSCTMNPNRECRMCRMMELSQKPMSDLLAIIPWAPKFRLEDFDAFGQGLFDKEMQSVLPKLRSLTGDCPACIMAAFRQRGIPMPMVKDFNFTEECKRVWADFNEAQQEESYY